MSNFFLTRITVTLLAVIIIAGCARQFHTQTDVFERSRYVIMEEIRSFQHITDFKGSGNITIVQDGRRSSGKCDVRFKSDGSFKAQIYSPFGSTAARIDADSSTVRLSSGKEEYSFSLDESMGAALSFSFGPAFTFRQFMLILIGKMPAELILLETRPDSLAFDKSSAVALWNRDTLTVEARIGRKSGTLESVTFNYEFFGDEFALRYDRFKNGAPGEISICSDSKNYILFKYDR